MAASACTGSGGASARLQLSNDTTVTARYSTDELANGTSLRLKLIAVYLAEAVDPVSMNNTGNNAMIWLNPECDGDISDCNVAGFAQPPGPRIMQYFDLARPTADVNADLNSQDAPVDAGTYSYARVELCKALGGETEATVPTLMWKGPGMTAEQPFTDGGCGVTSLPFDPPLTLASGDAVTVSLGYDLGAAVVAGAPAPGDYTYSLVGHDETSGQPHVYRACFDVDADHRVCMDYPQLSPTASRL